VDIENESVCVDCGDVVGGGGEFGTEIVEGVEIGVFGRREISKISTTFE
jgi:hypothetical protein